MKETELVNKFKNVDTSDFMDFNDCETTLERGLWILWVGKEKLGEEKLTATQIASIMREVKDISIKPRSITNSFNNARDKIHTYKEGKEVYYKIMKPGKDYLLSKSKKSYVELYYFEPNKQFTSKKLLSEEILNNLKGVLKIVDPYCDKRTLDILGNIKDRKIKFLTRVENLRNNNKRKSFLRELKDFKLEYPDIEFRNYQNKDIHDRYIISSENLVLLGHSIKDLGSKESFAVKLDREVNKDISKALIRNFDIRWVKSNNL